ncbi:hypothetical protein XH99_14715 [Bradyrhizobium nanningense]|uniref:Uncharacterized protein n=1 Tax=Bradyrhizobium nanningense TaxID=1325118 RepID=A0A4V1L270_9BRAD|nr:hypothetical protein XH99_14715 [Bradyrhizobium nanningense]RXH29070.1 hypothetical protein XH84_23740 [Bradyrhizobium nanningense]TQF33354.1 hypothetical protein UNPA324_30270 [Bradyrhizobium sp. UNPA324]
MIKLRLDYSTSPRKIFARFDLDDYFQGGSVMGFSKFARGTSLGDKDRRALQKLLGAKKK